VGFCCLEDGMKRLSVLCSFAMVFAVGTAQAQQYEVAPAGTKAFITAEGVPPNGTICFDVWLTGAGVSQQAGGAWIDFTDSTDVLAYVSAAPALNDGSQGVYGPWNPVWIPFPPELPGIIMLVVANLAGAAPDGDGDLIIGRVCLANIGPGDGFVNITTIPGVSTWTPADDATINANTTQPVLTIQQVCDCTTDMDCHDGLWCSGYEFCDPMCVCNPGSPPCDHADECTRGSCTEPDPLCGTPGFNCEEGSPSGDGICENPCDVSGLTGPADPCCGNPVCLDDPICLGVDEDRDGIENTTDNCTETPNGPYRGICTGGSSGDPCTAPGPNESECGTGGFCSMNQEDTYPPGGNGIGDACECEADFNCDGGVASDDVTVFLNDFGRSHYTNPCTSVDSCNGDLNCDGAVAADDLTKFLEDFGRSQYNNPCPACSPGRYCDGLYSCMSNDDCNDLSYCQKHPGQCEFAWVTMILFAGVTVLPMEMSALQLPWEGCPLITQENAFRAKAPSTITAQEECAAFIL
jgi:hypothetical protein